MAGKRRTIPSIADGKTFTPRMISMSSRRPRMPPSSRLDPRQKPDEEAEGKGKIAAIPRPNAGARQDEAPAVRPPVPRGLRLQPANGLAARPGGLVHADVALERIREVGAEGRVRRLIFDEVGLAQQRKPAEVVPAGKIFGAREAGRSPAARPERIHAKRLADERLQSPPALVTQTVARGRFDIAIE